MRMRNIKNNLQLHIVTSGKTVKNIKVEALLIFCLNLIREYVDDVKNDKLNLEYGYYMSSLEKDFLYSKIQELENYLLKEIYTVEQMKEIIGNKSSKEDILKAIIMEPRAYFYNILVKRFYSRMAFLYENKSKYYIPELLALYLIIDLKDKGYSFRKFTFIESFDFFSLIEIYSNINLDLRRKNNIKMKTPLIEQTTITKMQYLSSYLTSELIKSKYIKKKS